MKKTETKKLLDTIKGYYNSQFFIDEFVINAWTEEMKPYELRDALEHLKEYLEESPNIPPKPHTFKRGLLTPEQKAKRRDRDYTVECNLCHRWMPLSEYDDHYSKCLTIQYLVNIAKQMGEQIEREDLENCSQAVIDRLYAKYPPKKVNIGQIYEKL